MTLVDTPGFNSDDLDQGQKDIYQMVDVLKNNLTYVHVFVITFKGTVDRFEKGTESMIGLFGKMFGDDFWNNVVIAVTFWKFSQDAKDEREEKNLSEEKWAKNRIDKLKEKFPKIQVSKKHLH